MEDWLVCVRVVDVSVLLQNVPTWKDLSQAHV